MDKKFYAVKKGRIPGIYKTWDECKENVIKFPGAIYKSFESEEDAKKFVNDEIIEAKIPDNIKYYAYVDGSYNPSTKICGYGGILFERKESGNEIKTTFKGKLSSDDEELFNMRNVAGEIYGAMAAVEMAKKNKLPYIYIYHDYSGISMWARGLWKCNKKYTKMYHDYMKEAAKTIDIYFIKVKGHTGIAGNEEADKLAKEAVELDSEIKKVGDSK